MKNSVNDNLNRNSPVRHPFFSGMQVKMVSATLHTVVVLENGSVYSFGRGNMGQLGDGYLFDRKEPVYVSTLQSRNITSVAAGTLHTILMSEKPTEYGLIYAMGHNARGQLGLGNTDDQSVPVLIQSLVGYRILDIAAGSLHSLVLTTDGLFAFGDNNNYQLGLADPTLPRLVPTNVTGLPKIWRMQSAAFHTLMTSETGETWSFGLGASGQLGVSLAPEIDRSLPKRIDFFPSSTIPRPMISLGGTFSIVYLRRYTPEILSQDTFIFGGSPTVMTRF